MADLPTVTQTTPVERLWGIVLDLEDWSKELDALGLDKMARYALDKAIDVRAVMQGLRDDDLSQLTEGATDGNAQPV